MVRGDIQGGITSQIVCMGNEEDAALILESDIIFTKHYSDPPGDGLAGTSTMGEE